MAKLPTETERQQFIRATQSMPDINPQMEKMLTVSNNAKLLVNLLLLVSLIVSFRGSAMATGKNQSRVIVK